MRSKLCAEGRGDYAEEVKKCSRVIAGEYHQIYRQSANETLDELPSSSKRWWKLAHTLMHKAEKCSSIPPVKSRDGVWARGAREKANLFAKVFAEKVQMVEAKANE